MTRKEKYAAFCKDNQVPVFMDFRFWNTVFEAEEWDVAIAEWNGNTWGVLPFHKKKKLGFDLISIPDLVPYMGPWIRYPAGQKTAQKHAHEHKVLQQLSEQLETVDEVVLKYHPLVQNFLPFHWAGYHQTSRITYLLNTEPGIEKLYEQLRENIRREIKKGERLFNVLYTTTTDNIKTVKLKSANDPANLEMLPRYSRYLDETQNGTVISLTQNDQIVGSALFVWDSFEMYYITGAIEPAFRNSGGLSLLLWKGIVKAHELGVPFNFEGSMHPGIERFFRAFGGEQCLYTMLVKSKSNSLDALKWLKRTLKRGQ